MQWIVQALCTISNQSPFWAVHCFVLHEQEQEVKASELPFPLHKLQLMKKQGAGGEVGEHGAGGEVGDQGAGGEVEEQRAGGEVLEPRGAADGCTIAVLQVLDNKAIFYCLPLISSQYHSEFSYF